MNVCVSGTARTSNRLMSKDNIRILLLPGFNKQLSLSGLYLLEISSETEVVLSSGTLLVPEVLSVEVPAFTESSEVADTVEKAASPVVTAVDEHSAVMFPFVSDQPTVNGEDGFARYVDKLESDVDAIATAAAAAEVNDDNVEETASRQPVAQSVLSARDVFIEQQVTAHHFCRQHLIYDY